MNKNTRSITIITTMIQRNVHYVKKATKRNDGQYMVELTTDLNEAKELSRSVADEMVGKIFNPYDREYLVEDTLTEKMEKPKSDLVPGELD